MDPFPFYSINGKAILKKSPKGRPPTTGEFTTDFPKDLSAILILLNNHYNHYLIILIFFDKMRFSGIPPHSELFSF
jgi:hypothetical protein